jgi:hypothetical protein
VNAMKPPRSKKAPPKNQGRPEDDRPAIEIKPGRRPWMVDRAETVILDYQRWKVFQRGGILCRVVEIDPSNEDRKSIRRPEGAVVLKTVDSVTLEEIFSRAIAWNRRDQKGNLVPADCPPKVASFYLSRAGEWRLPVLAGVIEAPTILTDGTMVVSPGYDSASALFLCAPISLAERMNSVQFGQKIRSGSYKVQARSSQVAAEGRSSDGTTAASPARCIQDNRTSFYPLQSGWCDNGRPSDRRPETSADELDGSAPARNDR